MRILSSGRLKGVQTTNVSPAPPLTTPLARSRGSFGKGSLSLAELIGEPGGLVSTLGMSGSRGFTSCVRTIDHTELFVRATRGGVDLTEFELPPKTAPYWFQGRHL